MPETLSPSDSPPQSYGVLFRILLLLAPPKWKRKKKDKGKRQSGPEALILPSRQPRPVSSTTSSSSAAVAASGAGLARGEGAVAPLPCDVVAEAATSHL